MNDDLLGFGKLAEAFEKGTRELRSLVKTFLEPIAKEKGELKADKIRFERTVQAVKMMEKADRLLQKAKVKHRKLNPKIVFPLLEYSSLESDDFLTDKWAGLLASSVAGDPVHISFPKILAELTPGEAKLLDRQYTWHEEGGKATNWKPAEHTLGKLRVTIALSKEEFVLAVENLIRLKLIRIDVFWSPDATYGREEETHSHITPFGESFVRACRGPLPN